MSWDPVNLAHIDDRERPTPSVRGLLYPGGVRHVVSGPPEALKSWGAMVLALETIRQGGVVAWVDFEQGRYQTRDRLLDLGATEDDFERFLHIEPDIEASDPAIGELVEWHRPSFAVIDASAGAFALHGLDDNARRDVEIFATAMIDPFRVRGVSTVTLDHVTKSAETRGKFAIGSERKIGSCDVHLGFEPVVPFGRGRTGLVKIVTHKDRFGHLARGVVAELELSSDPDTYAITWQFREPPEKTDEWQPTALMEKVSRYVATQDEPVSQRTIEANVTGKRREYIRQAVKALEVEGFIAKSDDGRGYSHVAQYSAPQRAPSAPGAFVPVGAPGAPAPY